MEKLMPRRLLVGTLVVCAAVVGVAVLANQDDLGHRSSPAMEIKKSSICNGKTGSFTVELYNLPLQGDDNYVLTIVEGDHNPHVVTPRYTGYLTVSRSGRASDGPLECPAYVGDEGYTATVSLKGGQKVVIDTTFGVSKN
jgi:hypothetical protein